MYNKDRLIEQLNNRIEEQQAMIESLTGSVSALTKTIEELQETIKELRRQLNQNSKNSSKPPSSDGFKKPKPNSLRTPSGKKPGGQKGHKGSHMSIPHEPDEIKQHLPEKCQTCKRLTRCLADGSVFECCEKRYTVDAVVKTVVTEHQSLKVCKCPCGEKCDAGAFPEDIKAYVQYGESVTVLVGLMHTYGAVSAMRSHVLIGSLLGVSLSTGTIISMVRKCASKVGPTMGKIQTLLSGSDVGHFDETGADINGKLHWVHNSSTAEYTYQSIHKKRGKAGMEDNGVLPRFHGVAVHDRFSPYWHYDGIRHAICNIHIMRDLVGVAENNPGHKWPVEFGKLLMDMKKHRENIIAEGGDHFDDYDLSKYSWMYDYIMRMADTECPPPIPDPQCKKKKGRQKKGKERSLIEALQNLKESVCLFIHDFKVPFGNNQAEQDVRNIKTRLRIAGCFRTENGAQNYLDVMSYLSTGRKHGISAFDALTAAFSGNADIVLQPGF